MELVNKKLIDVIFAVILMRWNWTGFIFMFQTMYLILPFNIRSQFCWQHILFHSLGFQKTNLWMLSQDSQNAAKKCFSLRKGKRSSNAKNQSKKEANQHYWISEFCLPFTFRPKTIVRSSVPSIQPRSSEIESRISISTIK